MNINRVDQRSSSIEDLVKIARENREKSYDHESRGVGSRTAILSNLGETQVRKFKVFLCHRISSFHSPNYNNNDDDGYFFVIPANSLSMAKEWLSTLLQHI